MTIDEAQKERMPSYLVSVHCSRIRKNSGNP